MINEISKHLPKYLSARLSGISGYVKAEMYPDDQLKSIFEGLAGIQKKRKEELIKKEIDEASVLVFSFIIYKYFITGTAVAISMVEEFAKFGVKEVNIGSSKFAERNENVMAGQDLAIGLIESFDESIKSLFDRARYPYEIIKYYRYGDDERTK